jgi:hypothetical protein
MLEGKKLEVIYSSDKGCIQTWSFLVPLEEDIILITAHCLLGVSLEVVVRLCIPSNTYLDRW